MFQQVARRYWILSNVIIFCNYFSDLLSWSTEIKTLKRFQLATPCQCVMIFDNNLLLIIETLKTNVKQKKKMRKHRHATRENNGST